MAMKRKFSSVSKRSYKSKGSGRGGVKRRRTRAGVSDHKRLMALSAKFNRTIETKEAQWRNNVNTALAHNNVYVCQAGVNTVLNPFNTGYGSADPMDRNSGSRVGDSITVKGLMIKGFIENSLSRPKVYYRVMLVKAAKGDTIDRSTLFKNDADNKMIDQVNTERFTILAQKIFTVSASNAMATGVSSVLTGTTSSASVTGIATRTFKMWIPGSKFGRQGVMQYENNSSQIKFYDYRIVFVVYDWFGTPQDVNNVGQINELYTKLYFKDA